MSKAPKVPEICKHHFLEQLFVLIYDLHGVTPRVAASNEAEFFLTSKVRGMDMFEEIFNEVNVSLRRHHRLFHLNI